MAKAKGAKEPKLWALQTLLVFLSRLTQPSANPHEITLVESIPDVCFLENVPEKIIGDMAYDSDKLDKRLAEERGMRWSHRTKTTVSKVQLGCNVILLRRVLG